MRLKSRIDWPVVLFFIASVVLFGCSSPSQSTTGKEVNIAVSQQPVIYGVPTFMAMQKGWDKEAGLKIDLQLFMSGPPQNEALASNTWEVGLEGSPPGMLAAIRYGAYIIAVADDESGTNNIWVRPNSPIAKLRGANPKYPELYGTAATVKGKTILLTTASTGHYAVLATLKALGLGEQDVKLVHMEPQQILPAFHAGQGDIAQLWTPYDLTAENEGLTQISCAKRLGVVIPGVIVASKKAFEENPEKVAKWLRLYMRGVAEIKGNPTEGVKWLGTYSKQVGLAMDDKQVAGEFAQRPLWDLKQQLALFAKKDSGPSQVEQWMWDLSDFFVQQGRISPADKEKFMKGNFINDKILKMVAQ